MERKTSNPNYLEKNELANQTPQKLDSSLSQKMAFLNSQSKMQKYSFLPNSAPKFKSDTHFTKNSRFIRGKRKWKSAGCRDNSPNKEVNNAGSVTEKIHFTPLKKKELVDDEFEINFEVEEENFEKSSSTIQSFDGPQKQSFLFESAFSVSIYLEEENVSEIPVLPKEKIKTFGSFKIHKQDHDYNEKKLKEKKMEVSILFSSMELESLKSNYENNFGEEGLLCEKKENFEISKKEQDLAQEDERKLILNSEIYGRIAAAVDDEGNLTYQKLAEAFFPKGVVPNFTMLCNFRLVERMLLGLQ